MGCATAIFFLAPPPGAVGRGQKVKYHLISITKSISKILYQALCLLSQMKEIKNISDGILILLPGSCPGAFGVPRGSKKIFFET